MGVVSCDRPVVPTSRQNTAVLRTFWTEAMHAIICVTKTYQIAPLLRYRQFYAERIQISIQSAAATVTAAVLESSTSCPTVATVDDELPSIALGLIPHFSCSESSPTVKMEFP